MNCGENVAGLDIGLTMFSKTAGRAVRRRAVRWDGSHVQYFSTP